MVKTKREVTTKIPEKFRVMEKCWAENETKLNIDETKV